MLISLIFFFRNLSRVAGLAATDYVLDIMTVSVAHFYVKDIIQQVIHDNK